MNINYLKKKKNNHNNNTLKIHKKFLLGSHNYHLNLKLKNMLKLEEKSLK